MAISPKTIYLEPDEEITSVIDKIRKTEYSDIVLVIPKGASISQSVVNLKLIKKKAEDLSKSISIVTGDKVARALADKIGIPAGSTIAGLGAVEVATVAENGVDPLLNTDEVIFNKEPVEPEPGELSVREGEDVEAEVGEKEELLGIVEEAKQVEKPKNLMPKFPWLKVGLFVGIPVLLLLAAAYIYLPQAKSNIFMKADRQPVTLNFVGQKDATLDTAKEIVPTQTVDVTKDSTKKFSATGQRDDGNKATGTVFVSSALNDIHWVAGTRLALGSDSSLVYKTNSAVDITAPGSKSVTVTAENAGDKYNIGSGKTFVAVNDPDANITSTSAMTGGSTKMVNYVTQGDFNSAKDSLSKDATNDATSDFTAKTSNLKVIDTTKKVTVVSATATPNVGETGTDFSLDIKVEIKALAISTNDLGSLVKADINSSIGTTKTIVDDGSSAVNFQVDTADLDSGAVSGTLTTTAFVANKLDQDSVKTQLEGLNNEQATNYLKGLDGVSEVKNDYFPPFLQSFPRIKEHITLNIGVDNSSRN